MLSDPDRIEQTKTFRTRLAANVSKYITSRYLPRNIVATENTWNANDAFAASVKKLDGSSGGPNPSSYFYYQGSSSFPLLTVTQSSDPIIITKPTVLYVKGADVYIQKNIKYSGIATDYPSLVIVVQKDSATGK
jgi:hypothetical protein